MRFSAETSCEFRGKNAFSAETSYEFWRTNKNKLTNIKDHDLFALSTSYRAKRAGVRVLGHRPSLPLELSTFLSDFRSSRSSFGGPIALFFDFCLIILVCGASAGLFSKKLVLVCRSWLQIFKTAIITPNARFPESLTLARNVGFP